MNYEIQNQGAFPILKYYFTQGEEIKAESDAMVAMTPAIDLRGGVEGGIMKGFGRMLAGEKFFFQYLTATRGPGWAMFAPTLPGDILPLQLDGRTYNVQKDGFLAGTSGIEVATKVQNLAKGIFNGGFFILKVGGKGTVFLSAYGAITGIELQAGEEIKIDNGHLVAWSDDIRFTLEKASRQGWLSSITSGEGLTCHFYGPGKIYFQTRNPGSFNAYIASHAVKSG